MSRLEIILSCCLFISSVLSVGILVYARAAIARLLMVSEELGDLQDMISSFAEHTKSVYELDMFYGDQTLQGLMEHALSFNKQMETFEFIYKLTEEEYDDSDQDKYQEESEET